jgi:hypothetical protein
MQPLGDDWSRQPGGHSRRHIGSSGGYAGGWWVWLWLVLCSVQHVKLPMHGPARCYQHVHALIFHTRSATLPALTAFTCRSCGTSSSTKTGATTCTSGATPTASRWR